MNKREKPESTSNIDEIFRELGMDKKPAMIPPPPKDQSNARLKVGACGKTVFPSENMAKKTARKRMDLGTGGARQLLAYFCRECAGWHLTSREPGRLKG